MNCQIFILNNHWKVLASRSPPYTLQVTDWCGRWNGKHPIPDGFSFLYRHLRSQLCLAYRWIRQQEPATAWCLLMRKPDLWLPPCARVSFLSLSASASIVEDPVWSWEVVSLGKSNLFRNEHSYWAWPFDLPLMGTFKLIANWRERQSTGSLKINYKGRKWNLRRSLADEPTLQVWLIYWR